MNLNSNTPSDSPSRKNTVRKTNIIGAAGFIISLFAPFLCWAPYYNWAIWSAGLACSIAGLIKAPRELGIAGVLVSVLGLIILGLLNTIS